jgi:hypothetical protein
VKPFDPVEAARPSLEVAQLNADLAESWAKTAEEYRDKARECHLEYLVGGGTPEFSNL